MSDEAGFLRAIAADLHDDLPRLAYADWLDDRSDPRGEYLRLQVELARTWTYLDQKPHLYARLAELTPALDGGWLAAVRRCTTPAPPVDVAKLFPELAPLAKTAVRLHPRPGEAPIDASKLGGPILWPQREPWPDCPEHGTPLVPVVQLRKADVPEVGFPPGTDLFQLLWCPRNHDPERYGPLPKTYWRERAAISRSRKRSPVGTRIYRVFDDASDHLTKPCCLHPERVKEYPDPFEFRPVGARESAELQAAATEMQQTQRSNWSPPETALGLYQSWLSCGYGTKVGGHPNWVQDEAYPNCSCGARMDHLMSLASREYDGASWGRWLVIEDRRRLTAGYDSHQKIQAPAGWCFGDAGTFYLFVCRLCPGWPVITDMQFS